MPCAPRMSRCKRTCLHRQLVQEYQAARIAAEMAREDVTRGHRTETEEYGPILDFKTWLIQTAKGDERATETAA